MTEVIAGNDWGWGSERDEKSETALFAYKCTELYQPQLEYGVSWQDPDLGIQWPIEKPLLSEKDLNYPRLKDIEVGILPRYFGE